MRTIPAPISPEVAHIDEGASIADLDPAEHSQLPRRKALGLIAAGAFGCAATGLLASIPPLAAASKRRRERGGFARLSAASRSDLEFGKLASLGSGGYVTVDSETGTKLVTGSLVDLGGRHQRAWIDVRGEPGEGFVIFLPSTLTLRGRRNGRNRAIITEFRSFPATTGFIGDNGRAKVLIGATIEVSGAQAADLYRVRVPIRVRYL